MAGAEERTVLIVDDDLDALIFLKLILETRGYRVLVASRAETALRLLRRDDLGVDLLLTNVVMPAMNGGELARGSRALRPTLPILFMSRFADTEAVRLKVWDSTVGVLDKHSGEDAFLGKIYDFLGATPPPLRQPQRAFRASS